MAQFPKSPKDELIELIEKFCKESGQDSTKLVSLIKQLNATGCHEVCQNTMKWIKENA